MTPATPQQTAKAARAWSGPNVPSLGPHTPRRGNGLSRGLGRLGLVLLRWRFEGAVPDVPRCVAIVAPHTSNWDFVVGLAALLAVGLRGRFLGKDTIFRPPFGFLARWAGGIPVDRNRADGVVAQAIASMRGGDPFFLALAPEGTRKRVDRWKTGFYRIAQGADVGIWPVTLDYRARVVRLHPLVALSGDMDADLVRLRSHFSSSMAYRPEGYVE
jgi:1-acyl-sn-glycerol-3-phosphate acyltransferase